MNAPCDPGAQTPILDLAADFPILSRPVHGRRLAYLDNGATTQKPAAVIEAEARFYRESNANIHRGVHTLSQEATAAYEGANQDKAARSRWAKTDPLTARDVHGGWMDAGDVNKYTTFAEGSSASLFFNSLIAGREEEATNVLINEFLQGKPIAEIFDTTIAEAMRCVGELWMRGELTVAQEH